MLAWARLQGPLGALGDDYRHAELVMNTSVLGKSEKQRCIADYLPLWRNPTDYRAWGIDLGDDPGTEEFTVDD
jgi:hypothetical protein